MLSKYFGLLGLGVVFVTGLDLMTKFTAQKYLPVPVYFKGGFALELTRNENLAFGLSLPYPLIISLSVLALVFLGFIFWQAKPSQGLIFSGIFIFGGAFGNLLERLLWGSVTDFLKIPVFPNFNLADAALTAGVLLFFYSSYKASRAELKECR